jgi:hypothetical protein
LNNCSFASNSAFVNQLFKMKKIFIALILFTFSTSLFAQLDTIHWLPPMHARVDWGPQYLILSTPETTAFPVTLRDGSGALITTVNISNSQPFKYDIGSSNATFSLVTEADLHKPLANRGIVVDGKKKFYAYFRAHSANQAQASDLTCKGRAALGKTFRVGHLLQEVESAGNRSNFVGIIATDDSTEITFSGFDPATDFRKNGTDTPSTGPEKMVLQKGECVVFAQYLNSSAANQPPNGFMGGLVEATKPIVINSGSWCGSPVTSGDKDSGIDQIVPLENVGKEYILCKGNGSSALERPLIVAHFDNTQIRINGDPSPVVTLNAGQFYAVPTSSFTGENNLHIRASQKIYVYQMIGGANSGGNELRTEGLIFVPPISCSIPNSIDNISEPNAIGTMLFDGGVMITAMRDSLVTVRIDGAVVNLGAPSRVTGNPDFVTYRNLTLFSKNTRISTISIVAQGAVQVAMYGQNSAASYAAFYSGFSKTIEPRIKLKRIGDGVCPDTLSATGFFDGVQWMYEDSILKYGKDTFLVVYAPGRYIARGYLGVCRQDETASDTIDVSFVSPQFPYTFKQPSCFGLSNGEIRFGAPFGGLPPYQFSVNNGATFSKTTSYDKIAAGIYKLVVRDSLGCYNRPLALTVGQPSELTVKITPKSALPDAIPFGQIVKLEGVTNRKVVMSKWSPVDSSTCKNCLTYAISPIQTTTVTLTVTDSAGCMATDKLLLSVLPNVFAPNVISPLSQSGNSHFILYSKEPLPIQHLAVYDRWGEHVFDAKNITTNALQEGWNGTFRGQKVDAGVFVFYAEVEVLPGRVVIIKGDVTVIY